MKNIVKGAVLSAVTASAVMAAGYKVPEQSLNSMALSAAYVAHTTQADTAYFNPANMVFMGEKQYLDGAITLANLPAIQYYNVAESKEENIVIPALHYVSAPMGNWRWGLSITAPGGLSKRWDEQPGKAFAEEFTLKIIEFNPSVAYKVSDNFSIGGGVRLIYSEGVVKSDSTGLDPRNFKRDMEGDTFEFGYNLAMSYRPTDDLILAATYRSNVDLDVSGDAKLYYSGIEVYNGGADVSVPLPAALNLSIAKTWNKTFTLEFNYERTFWSKYKTLDFNYDGVILPGLQPVFDDPIDKSWKDTNTYRVGATMVMDKITVMIGFAIDETPVPDKTLGFELPDSDAKIFSMGFRYQQNENLSWGAAFLYDAKEARSIAKGVSDNPVINANGASFNGGGAYLTTLGLSYEY